jgi:hypothetical protein
MNDKSKTDLDRKINLFATKSESEWAYTAQSFFEKLAPLWFTWLGWIFALGGVSFLAEKTGSTALSVIGVASYSILYMYFLYFFASFRIEPYHSWALSRPGKLKQTFALIPILLITLVLVMATRELIEHVVEQVKSTSP